MIKIGVVGFSRNAFDRVSARRILTEVFTDLRERHGKERVAIVSGLTNSGVPALAHELAAALGFHNVGFSARQAYRVRAGVCPVDETIIVGERFGEESTAFVAYLDGLIRVGGGPQSRREVALFRERHAEKQLDRRLKEYEVTWYGKPPATARPTTLPSPEVVGLDEDTTVEVFRNVPGLHLEPPAFTALWDSHPEDFHEIIIHGRAVRTPRWQQAYGRNYSYTGSRNNALPITPSLRPFLDWSRRTVDERLNGLLLNWYDGEQDHYIGAHRDSSKELIVGTPIVTISLGEERVFRFRPYGGEGYRDVLLGSADALVIPWDVNQRWTHEVPKFKRYRGRRISVTLRGFV